MRPNFLNTKMKKMLRKWALLSVMAITLPAATFAQDKVEAEVGADLVSKAIWRGQDLGGVSVQPSLTVSYKGLSLNVWGSVGFESEDAKEIDLTLAYEVGGLNLSITDYWVAYKGDGAKYFKYGAHSTAHVFEAHIGYDFGPIALDWYTNFAGCDGVNKDEKRAYSSYMTAIVPFNLGGLEWEAEVGATPWATDYYEGVNGFAVCDLSLTASKEITVTESFSIPAFAKLTFNPAADNAYFTFGLSF